MRFSLMKSILKIFTFGLLGLILLILGAAFFTQSRTFKSWLKDFALEKSGEFLNAELSVKNLSGNFYSTLILEGLELKTENETLVKIEEISLGYDLTKIFQKGIQVNFVRIKNPTFALTQLSDSTWNFEKIAKPSEEEQSDSSSFDFDIYLNELSIKSAKVKVSTIDSALVKIPRKIENLNLNLNANYVSQKIELELKSLNFKTSEPDFNLALKTEIEQENETLKIQNFKLQTDSTNLVTSLFLENFTKPNFDFNLSLSPLSLTDVAKFSDSLSVYGNPKISLKAKGGIENFEIDLGVQNFETDFQMKGFLGVRNEDFTFDLNGKLKKLNLEKWLGQKDLKSDLNLDFEAKGELQNSQNPNVIFAVNILPSEVLEQEILASKINGKFQNEELNFQTELNHKAVKTKLNGSLNFKNELSYKIDADFAKIRIENFVKDFGYKTNLNAKLKLNGQGTEPEKIISEFKLNFYDSKINDFRLEKFDFKGIWKNEFLTLKEFQVDLPFVEVIGKGGIGVERKGTLNLEILLEDLQNLSKIDTSLNFIGNGKINAQIQGVLDSIEVSGNLDFPQIVQEKNKILNLIGDFEALKTNAQTQAKINLESSKITVGETDSLETKLSISLKDTVAVGDFEILAQKNGLFKFETKSNFLLEEDKIGLEFEKFNFDFQEQIWSQGEKNPKIKISGTNVRIEDFTLESSNQKVQIFGEIDSEKKNDFNLKISQIDLEKAFQKVEDLQGYSGFLNFDFNFTETFFEPKISGKIEVFENKYQNFSLREIKGNFEVNPNRGKFDFRIHRTKKDSILKILGFVPIEFSLSPFNFVVNEDDSLNFSLKSKALELGFLQGFVQDLKGLNGTFTSEINLTNSLKNLEGNGFVKIENTSFEIKDLGNKYKNMNVLARLKKRELSFEKFEIYAGKGSLKIENGSLSIAKNQPENFTTTIVANKFPLIDTKKIKLISAGRIEVSGSIQEILFNGKLVIPESKIYYSDLIPEDESLELTDTPFFVIGENRDFLNPKNAKKFQESEVILSSSEDLAKMLKKVKGNLKISLPRNTWLKSTEANIEVEGDLDLVKEKNSENFLIYGTLNTVRGYYELQGNRFQIEEGELNFKGNPKINPDLNIYAINAFRNKTEVGGFEQRELGVKITGTMEIPILNFTLDGNEVEQKDVISILLFGQTFDQLSHSQRKGVSNNSSTSSQAGSVITTQVLKGISNKIGKELNLDIFEIEKGKSLQNSTVKVGKYLTPNVFVSVSQEFGSEDGQRVELEYKLPKEVVFLNLFIQAEKQRNGSSGLDLIWKYEW
ncbi:MAG: translocation/assembly module TamB [Calditrichaeota bacterium]|nr:MAG: translocation/assembly module TamB [Calditrichota bacterium]